MHLAIVARASSTAFRAFLPGVISHGEVRKHPRFEDRVVIIQGDTFAVFMKDKNGHFLFNGMEANTHAYAAQMRRGQLLEAAR